MWVDATAVRIMDDPLCGVPYLEGEILDGVGGVNCSKQLIYIYISLMWEPARYLAGHQLGGQPIKTI